MTNRRPYLPLDGIEAMRAERKRQATAYDATHDAGHTMAEWNLILSRTMGKLSGALLRIHWPNNPGPRVREFHDLNELLDARAEAIQVGAICAALIQQIDQRLDAVEPGSLAEIAVQFQRQADMAAKATESRPDGPGRAETTWHGPTDL